MCQKNRQNSAILSAQSFTSLTEDPSSETKTKLSHLISEKPPFVSWQRYPLNEVNNWAPKTILKNNQ